ncbi:MAG: hypothetical protein JW742_03425 [Candidatus Aminicenantes bacterium]|nr:hypothetical protein [Candidatus Aminicenantes bacterium]
MKSTLKTIGVVAVLGWMIAGGAVPLAAQATTKYLAIPANALKPANWDADNRMWTASQTVFNFDTGATPPFEANAPVYLPQGAVIKKVTFYFTDNDPAASGKIDFSLNRQKLSTGGLAPIATASTGASATSASRKSIDAAKVVVGKVDNLKFSYSLNVRFGLGTNLLKFHAAVIWYE